MDETADMQRDAREMIASVEGTPGRAEAYRAPHIEPGDDRSEAALCQNALDAQNASNLIGVVNSWRRDARRLLDILWDRDACGTDTLNRHPMMVLYADKCAQLAGCQFEVNATLDAYRKAHAIIAADKTEG